MAEFIKNAPKAEVFEMAGLVEYQEGQVVSRTLVQNQHLTLTLFAFEAGEGISSHSAPGDALVQILEGAASIDVGVETFNVSAGQSLIMPAGVPHGLEAETRFKMLLTLVKESL